MHRTDPPAGTIVLEDSAILVFFNPSQELAVVPQILGIQLEDAELLLETEGFVVGTVTPDESSDRAAGQVLSSEPAPQIAVPQGTVVKLLVRTDHQAILTVDGQFEYELQDGDWVTVQASPHVGRFVRLQPKTYFYRTLMERLRPPLPA